MNGPFSFHVLVFRCGELARFFHHVGELKHGAHDEARRHVHGEEAEQQLPPGKVSEDRGQRDHHAEIQQFADEQLHHFLACGRADLLHQSHAAIAQQLGNVSHHLGEGEEGVEEECIPVLKAVNGPQWRAGGHAQKRRTFEVFIIAADIGVRVVQHIVLHAPGRGAAAQHMHDVSEQLIQPVARGERAVSRIVHHRHAGKGKSGAADHREDHHEPKGHAHRENDHKWGEVQARHHDGFEGHFPVSFFADFIVAKVGIHLLTQFGPETAAWSSGKFETGS